MSLSQSYLKGSGKYKHSLNHLFQITAITYKYTKHCGLLSLECVKG